MIFVKDKKECVGCASCVQVCPLKCIVLQEDKEGFKYPFVNLSVCINCSLCEKVCPVISQKEQRIPHTVFAAKNHNENVREKSSSGGIFTLLAEEIIKLEGVVFGAKFDPNWNVIHQSTNSLDGLKYFQGSKYLQSNIGETYKEAKTFLESGKPVLYSGTPCQIAGLKLFLRKEYEKLFAVDFICHGVPSPKVWTKYLEELIDKIALDYSIDKSLISLENIFFRDKTEGWKKFSFKLELNIGGKRKLIFRENLEQNIFLRGFLRDIYLRPSCHNCPAKSLKSGSDITIADFWGIENLYPDFDDDKGVSLLLINSLFGEKILQKLSLSLVEVDFKKAIMGNSALISSSPEHKLRQKFMQNIDNDFIIALIDKTTRVTLLQKSILFKNAVFRRLKRLISLTKNLVGGKKTSIQ